MSKKILVMLASGLAMAALLIWVVMTQGPLASVKVTTGKVQRGDLSNQVFGVGTLEARYSYNLAPIMTGRLKTILVDQGDRVEAGQVLAEMDPVDLDEKFSGAQRAAQRVASAILAAEAQVAEARSRSTLTSATFARYEDLSKRGFVSQEMLEAKRHELNAALAAANAASAALTAARQDSARAHADVAGIAKLKDQTKLVSPVDGVVVSRLFEPGTTVVAGQAVLQLVDPASIWVKTRIDQKQAGMIDAGQAAQIVLRSRPQSELVGRVARVDMISDAVTEERIANVLFQDGQPTGNIGEAAEVTISLPTIEGARFIPSAAIKRIGQHEGVWLLQDGSVQFRPVRIGMTTLDGRTQILDGISDTDEFVVYSQQPLQPNLKVRVVQELVRSTP